MKTIKVCWTERDVIEYEYEEELEVADDFVVDSEQLKFRIELMQRTGDVTFDSKFTIYKPICHFIEEEKTEKLNIPDFEIDSYEEITPPPIEEKKIEYLQLLKEMDLKIDGMKFEKERIEKLLTELK